jgi:hypothetical protein
MSEIKTLSQKLEKLIDTMVEGREPPRLVRANSAFELQAALKRAAARPDLVKLLDW